MVSNICIHSAFGKELQSPDLGRFYKRNGHKGRIQSDDRCTWLSIGKEIVAAARLSTIPQQYNTEQGALIILRGLWVGKQHRGLGLGRFLLEEICTKQINSDLTLYCFAYDDAVLFYQKLGFKTAVESAPSYLLKKQKAYCNRGSKTQLMVYNR
ncbi:GNAT family N-acetyltransferase [Neptuniibacter sp. PT34_22]|uniref:GNAT family N-acetyltransferase n=1 Tax=Neptuniibacter sp. PT34_22 TaxID=3398205 RepID=UPI0039F49C3F